MLFMMIILVCHVGGQGVIREGGLCLAKLLPVPVGFVKPEGSAIRRSFKSSGVGELVISLLCLPGKGGVSRDYFPSPGRDP